MSAPGTNARVAHLAALLLIGALPACAPPAANPIGRAAPELKLAAERAAPAARLPGDHRAAGGTGPAASAVLPPGWQELASRVPRRTGGYAAALEQDFGASADAQVGGFDDGEPLEIYDPYDFDEFMEIVEYLDGMFVEIGDDAAGGAAPEGPPPPPEPPDPFSFVEGDDDEYTVRSKYDPEDEWFSRTPEQHLEHLRRLLEVEDDEEPARPGPPPPATQPPPPAPPRPGVRITSPDGEPLEQVMLGQPFRLTVDLPADRATADAIDVTVATQGGSRRTLTLPRSAAQPGGGVVRYAAPEPASIAGRSTTDGFRKEGTITGLTHANGQAVTFTTAGFDGVASLNVYDDEIQLGIVHGSGTLAQVFDVLVAEQQMLREMRSDPEAMKDPDLVRELDYWQSKIDNRLRAFRRGRESIAKAERPMDKLALTEYFLRLLLTRDEDGAVTVVEDIDDRLINEYAVLEAQRLRRQDLFIQEVALGYTKGLYSTLAHFTLVGPIRQLLIEKNEFNEDASREQALKELGIGALMIVIPAGAAMRWGAGKTILPSGGIPLPGGAAGSRRVLVPRGPGRLSGQTAGGQLPLPSARAPLTGGLTEAQVLAFRARAMRNSLDSRPGRLAEIDLEIARIDAEVVRARQHGVPESTIARTLAEAPVGDPLPFIRGQLYIESAIANGQRVLYSRDQIAMLREFVSSEQLNAMAMTPVNLGVIGSLKSKALLEVQGKPQLWTAEELQYVRHILERMQRERPASVDRVGEWLMVEEVFIDAELRASYDGLSRVFESTHLDALRTIDWSTVRTVSPAPAAPPAPVRFPPGTRANPLREPGGSTVIERAPQGPRTEVSLRNPVAELRQRYGQDSPAARAVDVAVRELGREAVAEVAGSYARGDARAQPWPAGLSYRDAKMLDKLGKMEYTPDQLARMPQRVQELYRQREAMGGGKALPSDLDIVLRGERDAYVLDQLAERIFNETGVLVEFTEGPAVSAVPAPAAPAQPAARAAPPPAPRDAPAAPAAAQPSPVGRAEPVIPPELVARASEARQEGVPRAVVERILRANLDGDQPYGAARDAIAKQLDLAVLDAREGRLIVATYEMPHVRPYASAEQIRHVVQVDNPAVLYNAITRARQQASYQKGEWAQPTWTRAEHDAARQLLNEGERILGWKKAEITEFRDGTLDFGGLRQLYDAHDLRLLHEVDWSRVRVAPDPPGTMPGPPIRIPPAPGPRPPVVDPGRHPEAFGGPSGRSSGPAAPEVVVISKGGSTGPVFEMYVVNGGKPLRLQGDFVLEPVAPGSIDRDARARIDRIIDAAAGGRSMIGWAAVGPGDDVRLLDGAVVTKILLNAYCLEFDKLVPGAGAVYRIADRAKQLEDRGLLRIPAAARRLLDASRFRPDSDPEAYYHSIVQWSVWTREKRFDFSGFEDAFLEHARRNFRDAGHAWTAEAELAVRGLLPDRWRAIQTVLHAARR